MAELMVPKDGVVRGEADRNSGFEPQGLTDTGTMEDTIAEVAAQVVAAEKAAAQQATQADVQPAAPAVEPTKPLAVTVGPDGNVLPSAVFTGDFASDPSDLQPDKQ